MNTLIITRGVVSVKPGMDVYVISEGTSKCKSTSKVSKLGLTSRRVANTSLFNNDTLVGGTNEPYGTNMVRVGLKFRGAERMYYVPTIWKKDCRGNYRRYITAAAFKELPSLLQCVAHDNGVDTSKSLVIFSRCVTAWAGHNVQGMHVHHVNMDTTDDRLGNLHILSPNEHAAIHSNKDDLLWDAEWCEYTQYTAGMMGIFIAVLDESDIASPIPPQPYIPPSAEEYIVDLLDIVRGGGDNLLLGSTIISSSDHLTTSHS
jgi:hypothetical protein